ncbi:MAG: outer membrane protein assembly factor BamE [Rhodocyclaceae bacterium]
MSRMNRGVVRLAVAVALVAGLSSCSYLREYRIAVRQGNYVSQDMLSQLKPGMTQDQVRYIMGSPLLIDPFRNDRWDYVYRFAPSRGEVESRNISLFFKDSKLDHVEGDVSAAPATQEGNAMPAVVNRVVEIEAPAKK